MTYKHEQVTLADGSTNTILLREYTIKGMKHDQADDCSMTHMGLERAQWTANLLKDCGYALTTVTPLAPITA